MYHIRHRFRGKHDRYEVAGFFLEATTGDGRLQVTVQWLTSIDEFRCLAERPTYLESGSVAGGRVIFWLCGC